MALSTGAFPMSYAYFDRRRLIGLIALIACIASPSLKAGGTGNADLVTNYYLDIDGVTGEVTDPGFEGQIGVLSYSVTGTGGPGEMSLTKPIDSSSPALVLLVATGQVLQTATLTAVQTVNGKVTSSTTIEMQNVLLTSLVHAGDTEALTLSFQASTVKTTHGGIGDSDPVISMYLDIKGISGDVTDRGFEGQIEVLSYSVSGAGGPGEMSLTKPIDSSSPELLLLVATGQLLKTASLTVVESVNGKVASRMRIDMQNVLLTSIAHTGDTEALTLSFQRSKVTQ
jgi:type VI protein secretion system component Hcp